MIMELRYGDDKADLYCICRVTRSDSAQEFVYLLANLISKYHTVYDAQIEHLFPGFMAISDSDGWAAESIELGEWVSTEEEARQQAIDLIVAAFDTFNGWPQYTDHAYLPGETYTGTEVPTPPGQDPHKKAKSG